MRWFTFSCILLSLLLGSTLAEWSWGEKSSDQTKELDNQKSTELLQGEKLPEAQEKNFESNSTVLDDIVDELVSSKQGRSLGGFDGVDDVYSDPTIKEALDAGDDAEARNLIKGRLCTLGLIECDEESQEKRTYLSPDELIYAQPVDIKPVGKPIASIPVRGPPRAYGPPKPMPYPSRPQKIPPKRVGYGGNYANNYRPGFSEKYGVASNNFQFSQSSGLYSGHESNYVTKPPSFPSESPYAFENSKPIYNKGPITQSSSKTESVVQQHVHHHYVHGEGDKEPKVIIKPVAIPVGSIGHLESIGSLTSQSHAQQSTDIITGGGNDFSSVHSGGFKPMTGGYLENKPVYETDTIYGSQYSHNGFNKGSSNILTQSLPNLNSNNGFEDQKYGNSLGAYATQNSEFYKKELNVGSTDNLYNRAPATFGQNNVYQNNYHEAKAQGFDCVCVNYDQCPSQEIIGRRDDLYLPIDPRNKGSDITALTEEQLDNLTKVDASESIVERKGNDTETDVKKISKRETKDDDSTTESSKEIQPRLIGLAGYGGNGGNNNKQVQPTFGVSFGLPQPTYGGYPINPFNSNPLYNPYGPALNSGGLNLGLISVNPLLSVQVSKNDYGEKVVKPFVNLHVTPNEHVVDKFKHLFHEKKLYLLNKHEHYHHFTHPHHFNHYHKPIPPPYPHYPQHHGPPVYSPHYPHYKTIYTNNHPYDGHPENHGNDDYYDDEDNVGHYDDNNDYLNQNYGFERSANTSANDRQSNYATRYSYSRSLTLPPNHGASRGGQTVRFPENRKKREINIENLNKNIEERQGYIGQQPVQQCRPNQVCCRRPLRPQAGNRGQCGIRHSQGINGRIKTPTYVDGESEFGEYPWQAAILKKDPKESVYVCGGTLIDGLHIITAAHCIKSYKGFELRVRLGEWDVNRDVEFYPYIERDVVSVHVHPLYYAGTLDNDLAILKLDHPVEWTKYPHISPACLPDKYTDYSGQRCWTTGWGKDAFGDYGKYQNTLKEVDVPVLSHGQCQQQLRQTRLGYNYELNQGFLCAGGEEGKDACKGDGGGPLVCERGGTWQIVGVVSWGIGCGQVGVPGVYVKVAHYLDWISQITGKFAPY
ncbi:uncharacterized protein LOC131848296 isoform X2 [Achroia grisella]|uniref:uncharacterized protein LOC131848296 isoform X2 n=1 Tax=Achroia grisella TaxID=688607 RepID=UPI0027D2DCA4|nr:uncharacterized protein LOC131848296 isoform X2 [Achroia grisella]